jgi:hypothetical protein
MSMFRGLLHIESHAAGRENEIGNMVPQLASKYSFRKPTGLKPKKEFRLSLIGGRQKTLVNEDGIGVRDYAKAPAF